MIILLEKLDGDGSGGGRAMQNGGGNDPDDI